MLMPLCGSNLRSKILLENCPVGILAILSREEARLKEPYSLNFFFSLTQIQLDLMWPISVAQCYGESVLSLPVLKVKGIYKLCAEGCLGFLLEYLQCLISQVYFYEIVHASPTSLFHPQSNLRKTCSLFNC